MRGQTGSEGALFRAFTLEWILIAMNQIEGKDII
jgi:hypothetical protein